MAETDTTLSNFALSIVGGAIQADYPWIDDYEADAGTNGTLKWCQILLPRARTHIQSRFGWQRLREFAEPGDALATESANTVPGYSYCFDRPSGCLVFTGVVCDTVNVETGELTYYPFLEVGEQIACNYGEEILFEYTAANTDPDTWGEPLFQATGHYLALLLSRPMGASPEVQSYIRQLYAQAYADATADAAKERYYHKKYDPLKKYRVPGATIRAGLLYPRG
ncbi:MAG: hypothetical protein WC977_11790 [Anaerovoracaceae bacterium]|jgi:hypothetical protein